MDMNPLECYRQTEGQGDNPVQLVVLLYRQLIKDLQSALNPGWEISDPSRMRVTADPFRTGDNIVEQLSSGEWVEHAPYFDAVAVTGEGVFDTLKAVSKLVLKSLA